VVAGFFFGQKKFFFGQFWTNFGFESLSSGHAKARPRAKQWSFPSTLYPWEVSLFFIQLIAQSRERQAPKSDRFSFLLQTIDLASFNAVPRFVGRSERLERSLLTIYFKFPTTADAYFEEEAATSTTSVILRLNTSVESPPRGHIWSTIFTYCSKIGNLVCHPTEILVPKQANRGEIFCPLPPARHTRCLLKSRFSIQTCGTFFRWRDYIYW